MTARTLPGIGLTGDIDQGAPWKVAGDRNWLLSSVLTQLAVESATTSLPASPLNGVIYIVPAADANANQVAARDNGAWTYFPPFEGLTAYVRDTNTLMNFDGAAWVPSTTPLSAPTGAAQIGASYETSSTSISLPPTTPQFFMRSAPIDVRTVLPGNFVTDATVDYSVYVQKLLDYFRDFGGGRMLLPPNLAILIANLRVYSGTEIVAPEWTSQLVAVTGGYGLSVNPGSGGTTNPADNQRNILMSGFQLRGQAATPSFDEQKHLLNINAISWSYFEDLLIKGFQGDGIYLGSSNVSGVERHNESLTFKRILFDGVNRQNRNGMSIIDGTNIVVDSPSFYRTTRSDMPGALDIEPNKFSFPLIRNISVSNFYAEDCKAGFLLQLLASPTAQMATPVSRVSLTGFKTLNVDTPLGLIGSYDVTPLTKASPAQNIVFEQGSCKGGVSPLIVAGACGLTVDNVSFENFTGTATVGDGTNTRSRSFDVALRNTSWLQCGTVTGSALKADGITNFEYVNNKHIDCGDNTATGTAVEFSPSFTGALTLGLFRSNVFDKSALASMVATRKTGAGALSYDYRSNSSNTYNGLASVFVDDVDTAFVPTVVGSGTAGTATYTKQIGRRCRLGAYMLYTVDVTWNSHTGTGAMLVTLPIASAAAGPSVPAAVFTDSIAYTAGKTVRAQVSPGQTNLQMLQEGPGVAVATIPVSAAGTIRASVMVPLT